MIKFFRKIRQKLLTENSLAFKVGKLSKPASPAGRYLIYAIGEITLVVVGILIAVSINNWNEFRKNEIKAEAYLASIRADLLQDLQEIESIKNWKTTVYCFHKAFPVLHLSKGVLNEYLRLNLDETNCEITYRVMFNYHKSFRSNSSAFDAIISEGTANLISSKTLFSKLQHHYKFNNPAMLDLYNNHRAQSSTLKHKYAHLITFEPNTNITEIKDSILIADLNIFFSEKQLYVNQLIRIERLINEAITDINAELNE